MAFYITNIAGDKYITRDALGRISYITSPTGAWKFNDRKKAENVMINNLNGHTSGAKIVEMPDTKPPKAECDPVLPMIDNVELIADEDVDEDYINTPIDVDLGDIIMSLTVLPSKIKNEEKRLKANLRTVSQALTDMAHYLELSNNGTLPKLNNKVRNEIATFLEVAFVKRREIKDRLYQLNLIKLRLNGNTITNNDTYLTDRYYAPRILSDMFETHNIPNFEEWWGDRQ